MNITNFQQLLFASLFNFQRQTPSDESSIIFCAYCVTVHRQIFQRSSNKIIVIERNIVCKL